jgi:hypothetical protein
VDVKDSPAFEQGKRLVNRLVPRSPSVQD